MMTQEDKRYPQSTFEERHRALEAWAMKNPFARMEEARGFLKEHYGKALGNQAINAVMRAAREAAKQQVTATLTEPESPGDSAPAEPEPAHRPDNQFDALRMVRSLLPPVAIVPLCAMLLREAGVRSILLNEDGTFTIGMFTPLLG